ncbi:fungal-specific transcription factor domain-containing protein [Hypoxylon trugodes]|uniref:fungal-specific transcription factor domain-containing protein n=1 Tax=Hypoxylon trugodes TaxID=326681 RepID=UPI00219084BE|nr:fungal-specific transcription factor domain-containing protein [Hypoxylon trugodes]KAI1386299.1 fungal-specific transcription factor domain-containing protein [Hypoxylon trugodes]
MVAVNLEGKKPPKMRPPMRSSIACTRCRKSKIKCENTGGTSPCDSCIKTGKECIFKLPDPVAPKRTDPPTGVKQERDGGSDRKKLKKIDDISKVNNQQASVYAEEVLSAPFLTEDLWEQVLDLYKLHFAPELPFLHLPTMKEKLGRKFRASQSDGNSELNLVLLGVLTLTARFHPDLVKYLAHICNNQPGNARTRPVQTQLDPAAASEYYADVLTMALGPIRTAMKVATVERVAAFLMLGLYEWSQIRPSTGGLGAWMYVGNAVRMAQYLGLGYSDIPDSPDPYGKTGEPQQRDSSNQSQLALEKEIRRRTMFSCFILDRMLSCGKGRVAIIHSDDIQIQLPCSEDKFDLAMEVHTGFLKDKGRHGMDDSVLSRFIQLVDIWGDISKFSSTGGRLNRKDRERPPWTKESTFYQLSQRLAEFDAELPDTFTFSRSNYFKHENHQASSVYVLLHMLRCLCLIMLHREYIPFVPVRCPQPEGPLDNPTFPEDKFGPPPEGFWITSAEQVFKAARGIVDLIEICQRKDKLPQSTIVLFAIWTAGFVGLYGKHFPQMDTERHMLGYEFEDTRQPESVPEVFRRGSVAFTFATLHKMSMWLKMAVTYVGLLRQMDKYFENIKLDYYRHITKNGGFDETTHQVRKGGRGAGLEEYKPLVGSLKDFGFVQRANNEHDLPNGPDRVSPTSADRTVPGGAETNNTSSATKPPKSTQSGSFTAINHAHTPTPILPAPEPGHPFNNEARYPTPHPEQVYADPWRHHNNAHQHQQQQHQQPPLPISQGYPTSEAMLETTAIAAEAHDRAFWDSFKKEEPRRIGTIGDLGYFSSGDSQLAVADMPFADSTYIPALADSSYQYLQVAEY